eukprot:357965-Chlamydomonas_euryale.AAC.1
MLARLSVVAICAGVAICTALGKRCTGVGGGRLPCSLAAAAVSPAGCPSTLSTAGPLPLGGIAAASPLQPRRSQPPRLVSAPAAGLCPPGWSLPLRLVSAPGWCQLLWLSLYPFECGCVSLSNRSALLLQSWRAGCLVPPSSSAAAGPSRWRCLGCPGFAMPWALLGAHHALPDRDTPFRQPGSDGG